MGCPVRRFNAISVFDPITWNGWSEDGVYEWLKTSLEETNLHMNLLIDNTVLSENHDNENSYGVLIESPDILEWYHRRLFSSGETFFDRLTNKMLHGNHRFKRLYTFDKRYEGIPNTTIIGQTCYPSVQPEKQDLYSDQKNNLLTFITTNKTLTDLHRFRVELANYMIGINIPVFGHGYKSIACKSEVLKNSMFCVAIENGIYRGYHTEKVMDCFVTGCVPIYIGDPDIGEHYDTRGMIIYKTPQEMIDMGINVSVDLYQKMLPYVKRNFDIATKEYTPSFESGVRIIYEDLVNDNRT